MTISGSTNKADATKIADVSVTNLEAYYSCGVGYTNGGSVSGNITNDPLFQDAAGGDYRLTPNSPCVNTGTNGSWTISLPTDRDGRRRVDFFSGKVDMGCYEYLFSGTMFRGR